MAKKGVTRGTTPNLTFRVPFQVSNIAKLLCTFTQGGKIPEWGAKSLSDENITLDSEHNTISIRLTEAETLSLDPDKDLTFDLKALLQNDRGGDIIASRKVYLEVYNIQNDTPLGGDLHE